MNETIILKYKNKSFPIEEWHEFLKCFNTNRYTKKSTKDFPVWNVIRGRGYVIWISEPVLRNEEELAVWLIAVSAGKNPSKPGVEKRSELIQSVIEKFKGMEVVEQ